MNIKITVLIVFVMTICLAPAAWSQGTDTNEDSESTESEDNDESDDESEDEGTDEDLEDEDEYEDEYEDEDEDEDGDEDEEEPMSLDSPTGGLDLSALGAIDPEQDLTGDKMVDEDKAASQVVQEWTNREVQLLDIHGYYRLRPELYHKFNLRNDDAIYARPMEQTARDIGNDCRDDGEGRSPCNNNTLAGANMRLRIAPTLNVSETVRVKAQIDFLDNVMLGSSQRYYQNYDNYRNFSGESTINTGQIQGWDMGSPSQDIINVRRAWGEVMTPLGQLRFGRMGDHWGTGMLHHDGNGLDNDFGDSVDRIMFMAKLNNWLIAPAFDFPSEGISSVDATGRPFDVSQLDDAYRLVGIFAYKHDDEEQTAMLKRGDWLINTGLYFSYRAQVLNLEMEHDDDTETDIFTYYRRDMWSITPDLWFQLLYDTFHFEVELAMIYGKIGNPESGVEDFDDAQELTLVQFGGVMQIDYGLLSDQLRLGFEFGFASGDENVEGLRAPTNYDQINGSDDVYKSFSFNPAYNTDLILYHHLLGSVSQSYYFHPWLGYDFIKNAMGKRIGVRLDVIYSRAVFAKSTINNGSANMGIELNGRFVYEADNFYGGLKYGVLFPLKAFEGLPDVEGENPYESVNDLDIPQTLQVLLGIKF